MVNTKTNVSLLKLIISSLIQLSDIKSLFMLYVVFYDLDKIKNMCFNSMNHQGG